MDLGKLFERLLLLTMRRMKVMKWATFENTFKGQPQVREGE